MTSSVISGIILPTFGVGIVLFCLLSFVFPYGERFKDKVQKIKALGVDLEVSVLALFILVGVVMAFVGVYLRVSDYEGRLQLAANDANAMRKALEQAHHLHFKPLVALEGVDANHMPKLSDVRVEYRAFGDDRPLTGTAGPGFSPDHFQITLDDVTPATVILALTLEDQATGQRWRRIESILPLQPDYTLKRVAP
jgi:hypothetical protein